MMALGCFSWWAWRHTEGAAGLCVVPTATAASVVCEKCIMSEEKSLVTGRKFNTRLSSLESKLLLHVSLYTYHDGPAPLCPLNTSLSPKDELGPLGRNKDEHSLQAQMISKCLR